MEKKDQWNIGYWIVAGLLLLTLQNYWRAAKKVEPVPYSEFEKALAEGRVAEVLVADRTVTGRPTSAMPSRTRSSAPCCRPCARRSRWRRSWVMARRRISNPSSIM